MTHQPDYQSPAPPSDGISTLIPYKNGYALASYYIGLFSLFPYLGALMGPTAVILGIIGLKRANANPQIKGKAHAITGIVCGSIFGIIWIAFTILLIVMLISRALP